MFLVIRHLYPQLDLYGWVGGLGGRKIGPRQFQRDLWQTEQNRVGSPDGSDLVSECAEEKEQGRKDNGMSLLPSLLRRRTEDDGLIAALLARGTTKPDVSRRQCSATTPSLLGRGRRRCSVAISLAAKHACERGSVPSTFDH